MPAYADAILLKFKNRTLVVIVAPVILGVLLGGHILVKPMLKKLNQIETEKASYSEKETVFKNIQQLDQKLKPYESRSAAGIDKMVLIEELNTFAGKSGLTIISIVPDESALSLPNVEYMPIRIEAEGNYHQLSEFISHAESMKTYTKVTALEINRDSPMDANAAPAGSAPKSKFYKVALSLTAYSAPKNK